MSVLRDFRPRPHHRGLPVLRVRRQVRDLRRVEGRLEDLFLELTSQTQRENFTQGGTQ